MNLRIVIVDDQAIQQIALQQHVREVIRMDPIFQQTGDPEIRIFEDARSALNSIVVEPPDLVLTDLVMEHETEDGFWLLESIKAIETIENVPVIVITASDDEETKTEALQRNADDYLTKRNLAGQTQRDKLQTQLRIRNVLRGAYRARRTREALEEKQRELEVTHQNLLSYRELETIAAERHQAQLVEQRRILAETSKATLAAKDQFVAMVSHEFRTPLHTIIGSVNTLETRLRPMLPPAVFKSLEPILRRAREAGEQLQVQAADLADFVRAESGRTPHKPRRIELSAFAEDLVDIHLGTAAAKGIEIRLEAPSEWAIVDVMGMRQIVSNLLGNAVKYTSAGHVLLRLRLRSETPQAAAAGSAGELVPLDLVNRPSRMILEVLVRDTGAGIPAGILGRVFEPWVRSAHTESESGMGLGLAIVNSVVKSLNGRIELLSELGEGTSARVAIPVEIAPASPHTDFDGVIPATVPITLPFRTLIVDDTDSVRATLADTLADAGAEVEQAASGQEALEIVGQTLGPRGRKPFDIMFLDIQMAGIDGYEVARRIRSLDLPTKPPLIVAMSAYEIDAAKAVVDGRELFDITAPKPLRLDVLVRKIEEALSRATGNG